MAVSGRDGSTRVEGAPAMELCIAGPRIYAFAMPRHARPPSVSRLVLLAILALCLLAKPMAAFAAGLHEDLHAFAHALVHADAADDADDHPPAGPDDAEHDPVTGLHALMHK